MAVMVPSSLASSEDETRLCTWIAWSHISQIAGFQSMQRWNIMMLSQRHFQLTSCKPKRVFLHASVLSEPFLFSVLSTPDRTAVLRTQWINLAQPRDCLYLSHQQCQWKHGLLTPTGLEVLALAQGRNVCLSYENAADACKEMWPPSGF